MSKRKFQNGESVVSKIDRLNVKVKAGQKGIIYAYNHNHSGYAYRVKMDDGRLIDFNSSDLELTAKTTSIEKFQILIEQAKEKIEKTQAFIAETEAKISFLKETGSDTFDENEFKAFHTLTIIEQGNMSKIEKAKAIAALISKK